MENPRTKFFFIHGAWASPASFNYLRDKLRDKYETAAASYDCQKMAVADMIDTTREHMYGACRPGDNNIVVGHSLGGLIALSLEDEPLVSRVVTIASPLAGLQMNRLMEFYLSFRSPILGKIAAGSNFISSLHSKKYTKPIDTIVAAKGFNPLLTEPNDGVLTIECQTSWLPPNARLRPIAASHFDILQHTLTHEKLDFIGEMRS